MSPQRSGIVVQTVTEFANAWSFSPAPTKGMNGGMTYVGKHAKNLMKTDVRELDGSYELDVDLPGCRRTVTVDLQDGYLTISAAKALDKDESDQKGKFLRQERCSGSMSRQFLCRYDDVEAADISAKYEDGILKISVPKAAQKELPKHTTIAIE